MSAVDEMRRAVEAASKAHSEILRIASAFERHVEAENARIKRRLERIDAREERIIALTERLEAIASERFGEGEAKGISEEDRYRRFGEGTGMQLAARLIGETYR